MVYMFRHNSILFYLPQETAYSQIFMHVLVYHLVHYLVLELTFDLVRSPLGWVISLISTRMRYLGMYVSFRLAALQCQLRQRLRQEGL